MILKYEEKNIELQDITKDKNSEEDIIVEKKETDENFMNDEFREKQLYK